MSDSTNIPGQNDHPDRAVEAPTFHNDIVARWYRERIINRAEADVLDILALLDGDDQSGTPCLI